MLRTIIYYSKYRKYTIEITYNIYIYIYIYNIYYIYSSLSTVNTVLWVLVLNS